MNTEKIAQNIHEVKARIAEAALRVGRTPQQVQLVAVSKTFPVPAIVAAYHCGQQHFGENRPEEGARKIPAVAVALGKSTPTWHCIGHIQRRKVRQVVAHFDVIHTLDRLSVAQKLSVAATAAEKSFPVLLECNVSGEASKHGYAVAGWEQDMAMRETFYQEITAIAALPSLHISGLMTMAPFVEHAATVRSVFASLRALRDALQAQFPLLALTELSMGMSNDFEIAVEEGATLVRIGRAIFGDY